MRWPRSTSCAVVLVYVCAVTPLGHIGHAADAKPKPVAMLLPGELRFRDEQHFEQFRTYLQPFEVYIST